MAQENLSVHRPVVVAALPGTAAKGDTCVLSSDGHLYTYNGTAWLDNGAGGAAGAVGSASVNFGATPGSDAASAAITGQTAILSGSIVRAWVRLATSADHTADEHRVEQLRVSAGAIVAGTGFTIYADCVEGLATGVYNIDWQWS